MTGGDDSGSPAAGRDEGQKGTQGDALVRAECSSRGCRLPSGPGALRSLAATSRAPISESLWRAAEPGSGGRAPAGSETGVKGSTRATLPRSGRAPQLSAHGCLHRVEARSVLTAPPAAQLANVLGPSFLPPCGHRGKTARPLLGPGHLGPPSAQPIDGGHLGRAQGRRA